LNYASRILESGDSIYGYFKQISNVQIKEDHANPFVQYGITRYPNIIAEIRIELSSNDCNGNDDTYQDINEAALFISDSTVDNPGIVDNITRTTLSLQGTNRVSIDGDTAYLGSILNGVISFSGLVSCYYNLQMRSSELEEWVNVTGYTNMLITSSTTSVTDGTLNTTGSVSYRLFSRPSVKLTWTLPFSPLNHNSIQYRVLEDIYDSWSVLTEDNNVLGSEVTHIHYVNCDDVLNPLLNADTTEFRVVVRSEMNQTSMVSRVEPITNSYNVKYYVSNDDIDYINIGDAMYVTGTGDYISDINLISEDSPYTVVDKFVGNMVNQSYVLVTKEESSELDITTDPSDPSDESSMTAHFITQDITPYTMFSRVTFSTVRKTLDREIILLWKLYF